MEWEPVLDILPPEGGYVGHDAGTLGSQTRVVLAYVTRAQTCTVTGEVYLCKCKKWACKTHFSI